MVMRMVMEVIFYLLRFGIIRVDNRGCGDDGGVGTIIVPENIGIPHCCYLALHVKVLLFLDPRLHPIINLWNISEK